MSLLNLFGLPALLYSAAVLRGVLDLRGRASTTGFTRGLGLLAILVHGLQLFRATVDVNGLSLAITDSASLIGWIMALTAVTLFWVPNLRLMPILILIASLVLSALTGLLNGFSPPQHPPWELAAHIALAGLAVAWFGIAAISAVALITVHRTLRKRVALTGWQAHLPALDAIEGLLFQSLSGGFIALSFALLTVFFYVTNPTIQHLWHKIVFTGLAWVTFAILLVGRVRYGWRARRVLQFTLFGMANLLLGYFGSKFVLELLLNRHWG